MFFWDRKKEVQKVIKEETQPLSYGISNLKDLSSLKYKTNYYTSKSAKRRESLRSKKQRKDEIGEYKLEVGLSHLPKCFNRVSNLLLKTEEGFVQIDHLLLSPYGLFLVENYNLTGLIVGEEADPKWYQVIKWRVKTFPNPLVENQKRIQVLKEQIGLRDELPIYSYVAFNRRCNLKVFLGTVFYDTDILASILKLAESSSVVLAEDEIHQIREQIEKIDLREPGIRNEYYARLRRERMQHRPKYGDIRCHICQKPVTERIARHCLNRPEKFAWRVYCEKHQKEMTRIMRQERSLQEKQDVIDER